MEEVPFPDENCSGLTEEQFTAIALAKGITAAVGCTILSLVLVVLIILAMFTQLRARLCGTVIKRLTIGLIGVNVAYQLTLALHLVHYYHPQEKSFCEVDGFFNQYFASVQLFLTLEICLVLFIKVLRGTTSWRIVDKYYKKVEQSTFKCYSRKINKLEVALVATIIILPLLLNWIPFTTGSYGPYVAWCWIRILETDCSVHDAGRWEQIWLWYIPFGLVAFLTLGLFITSLCLLGYRIRNARVRRQIVVNITNSVISLALMLALRILQTTAYFHQDHRVINAICDPLSGTVIPLALLTAIHMPLSAMIDRCTHCMRPRAPDEQTLETRTQHHSSEWSIINKASDTQSYQPLDSDAEIVPFVNGNQQGDYGGLN